MDKTPRWFVAWFAFCAVCVFGVLALIAWAVITLVTHLTT